jgi:pyruvate kinase
MKPPLFSRTKIICTIGPASQQEKTLNAMINEGMDVARINLSHGDFETHKIVFNTLRSIGKTSILVDLPGPKIRLGDLKSNYILEEGDIVHFTILPVMGDLRNLPVNYSKLPEEVNVGGHVFINDGLIDVEVTEIDKDLKGFTAIVVSGGEISSRKGLNTPEARLSLKTPTQKDLDCIKFGVELDADWFAVSFVRSVKDVENVREVVKKYGGDQPLISKIEHGEAVRNIDEIITASDGIMVARGDLGIEIQPWKVPLLQKQIIKECNKQGKPVIVATQMLESMINNPRPTRAEASDVANAVLDGTDAVMLSGETAIGRYPVKVVRTMNSICKIAQEQLINTPDFGSLVEKTITEVIGDLTQRAVDAVEPTAIIVVTRSGITARVVSKHRPKSRIFSVSKEPRISRRMHLYWGVDPLDVDWVDDRDIIIRKAVKKIIDLDYIDEEDAICVVSGSSLIAPGKTTTLEILAVKDIIQKAEWS